jgi:hypothetical protein
MNQHVIDGHTPTTKGITYLEYMTFEVLVKWLLKHQTSSINECDLKRALMNILLSVDPNWYIYNLYTMGHSIRIILRRLCDFMELQCSSMPKDSIVSNEDLFTFEVLQDPVWTNDMPQYSASYDSWAYHCLVNGPVHPMTRQDIKSMNGTMIGPLNGPNNGTMNEPFTFTKLQIKKLRLSLEVPMDRDNSPIDLTQITIFESIYSIPHERCYSTMILQNRCIYEMNWLNITLDLMEQEEDLHDLMMSYFQ